MLSKKIKSALTQAQQLALGNPNNEILAKEEHDLQEQYRNALKTEEEFYRQKMRAKWNIDGNRNTRLFHDSLKIR